MHKTSQEKTVVSNGMPEVIREIITTGEVNGIHEAH